MANYEKRRFQDGEKVWMGHYRNLTNVLHWHFECELILVTDGTAHIKVGANSFDAVKGDQFFCVGEELHYILGNPGSRIDIMIFEKSILSDITDRYTLVSPKLPPHLTFADHLESMKHLLTQKGLFYRETLENSARALVLDIFRSCETVKRRRSTTLYNDLIQKINKEFAYITFTDAASWCGYSPSHFSKMFKTLSGMNFSDYLNIIKIENAIAMLQRQEAVSITSVSRACGFTTIRNFNRVFRLLTGFSPRSLPRDFILDTGLRISNAQDFDPTGETSVLLEDSTRS